MEEGTISLLVVSLFGKRGHGFCCSCQRGSIRGQSLAIRPLTVAVEGASVVLLKSQHSKATHLPVLEIIDMWYG